MCNYTYLYDLQTEFLLFYIAKIFISHVISISAEALLLEFRSRFRFLIIVTKPNLSATLSSIGATTPGTTSSWVTPSKLPSTTSFPKVSWLTSFSQLPSNLSSSSSGLGTTLGMMKRLTGTPSSDGLELDRSSASPPSSRFSIISSKCGVSSCKR